MLTVLKNLISEPSAEPPKRRKRERGSAKPHNRGPGARELEPGMYTMIDLAFTTRLKHKYRFSGEVLEPEKGRRYRSEAQLIKRSQKRAEGRRRRYLEAAQAVEVMITEENGSAPAIESPIGSS